jgi:outer membrane protein TolC
LEDSRLGVMQRVHTAMSRLKGSYPSVESTAVAADRALKTLEIVRDEYAQGKTGILDLLDVPSEFIP